MKCGVVRTLTVFFAVGVCMLLVSMPVSAQLNYGHIYGGVSDQTGGLIVGATVTVVDVQRGVARPLTTDTAGQYSAPSLLPGTYTVRAEAKGFKTVERTDVVVEVGEDLRVDLTLQPGEQTQTVTVTSEAPMINTTNAQLGGTLENQTLTDLPIQGRVYTRLLSLNPGMQAASGENSPTFSVNGNRPNDQVWMIDGVPDLDYFDASGPIIGQQAGLNYVIVLPIDSIQEMNVISNPKAEYGWKAGAEVNAGLKSGTNTIHGSAYALGRNAAMDAKNPFLTPNLPKAEDDNEQFGASIGGPIQKDKLFYFGNYEGYRFTVGSPQLVQIPSSVSGAGTSGSFVDAIKAINVAHQPLSPLSLNLAGCTSVGVCNPASGIFNNASVSSTVPQALNNTGRSDNFVAKFDYHLSDHHSFNGEYIFGDSDVDAVKSIQQYWEQGNLNRAQIVRGVWVWVPNSTWLNEARFGYDRSALTQFPAECTTGVGQPNYTSQFGFVSGAGTFPPDCGFPGLTISGFTSLGSASGTGATSAGMIYTTGTYTALDTISYTRGKHLFKFGGEMHLIRYSGRSQPINILGNINFGTGGIAAFTGATALESFLAGVPSTGTVLIGDPERQIDLKQFAGFIQDDWRITSRITADLGLRYEYQTPLWESNNLLGNFSPTATTGLVQQSSGHPVFSVDPREFEPRVGVAWDVTGKGTTVVRAGGSLVYNTIVPLVLMIGATGGNLSLSPTGFTFFQLNGSTVKGPGNIQNGTASLGSTQLPWQLNTPVFNVGPSALVCGNGLGQVNPNAATGAANPANPAPCNLAVMNSNFKPSYVPEWTLDIQHAFTNRLSIDVAYVGNHGARLGGTPDINQPVPGATNGKTAPTSEAEQTRRPYYSQFPYFGQIKYYTAALESNYNALQANVTERLFHGLTAQASYTYAHALDDFSSENNAFPMDSRNVNLDYANSNTTPAHHFTIGLTYILPGKKLPGQLLEGWQLNSTANIIGMLPYNATDSSSDLSGTGEGQDRWTMVGNPRDFSVGEIGTIPCFGITASSFAGAKNCTPEVAGPANNPTANMPALCQTAAAAEPTNPSVAGSSGLASLAKLGCYMQGNAAIVPPAQGTFGTMGRDVLARPRLYDWDFSVAKNWKFTEKYTVQFRAEFFNVLNHTLYASPASSFATPTTFGQAQSTPNTSSPLFGVDGPRQVQLGLRLTF